MRVVSCGAIAARHCYHQKEKNLMAEIIGKSPIPFPLFLLGKLAFLFSFLFFIVKWYNPDAMLYDSSLTQIIGISLFLAGLIIVIVGVLQLGQSRAFGLPESQTQLRTHGLYGITRNPMYLGGFIMCIGSCLYSIHPANFLFCAIALATHISVVKREEEFLAERFGQQWLDYQRRIPRFIGLIRRK